MSVDTRYVAVRLVITVHVDSADGDLLDRFDESGGPLSIFDVVRNEIESNLDSIRYVRRVSIKPKRKEVKT